MLDKRLSHEQINRYFNFDVVLTTVEEPLYFNQTVTK